jgi:hypothetical protein
MLFMVSLLFTSVNIAGDHMGQIALLGIIGPSGKFPSRFTEIAKKNISNISHVPVARDPKKTYNVLTKALTELKQHNYKMIAMNTLRNKGLVAKLVMTYDTMRY